MVAICRFCGQEVVSVQAVQPHLNGCEAHHDTLPVRTRDGNRSRRPLHPRRADLQARIEQFDSLGTPKPADRPKVLAHRMTQIAQMLESELRRLHAPLTRKADAGARSKEIDLGAW